MFGFIKRIPGNVLAAVLALFVISLGFGIVVGQHHNSSNTISAQSSNITPDGKSYHAGPFLVTINSFGPIPNSGSVGESYNVKNVSSTFQGYIDLTVQWTNFSGSTILGNDSGTSEVMKPGENEVVFVPSSYTSSTGMYGNLSEIQIVTAGSSFASTVYYVN